MTQYQEVTDAMIAVVVERLRAEGVDPRGAAQRIIEAITDGGRGRWKPSEAPDPTPAELCWVGSFLTADAIESEPTAEELLALQRVGQWLVAMGLEAGALYAPHAELEV